MFYYVFFVVLLLLLYVFVSFVLIFLKLYLRLLDLFTLDKSGFLCILLAKARKRSFCFKKISQKQKLYIVKTCKRKTEAESKVTLVFLKKCVCWFFNRPVFLGGY